MESSQHSCKWLWQGYWNLQKERAARMTSMSFSLVLTQSSHLVLQVSIFRLRTQKRLGLLNQLQAFGRSQKYSNCPGAVLQSMLSSHEKGLRDFASGKVLCIRNSTTIGDKSACAFKMPQINLATDELTDLLLNSSCSWFPKQLNSCT